MFKLHLMRGEMRTGLSKVVDQCAKMCLVLEGVSVLIDNHFVSRVLDGGNDFSAEGVEEFEFCFHGVGRVAHYEGLCSLASRRR